MNRGFVLLSLVLLICFHVDKCSGRRRGSLFSQHKLGETCLPGSCSDVNAICQRDPDNLYRCVCKDKFMIINETRCVRVLDPSIDDGCASCQEMSGICLDENDDNRLDRCFHHQTQTQTKKVINSGHNDSLTMRLYNVEKKRWLTNRVDRLKTKNHLTINIEYEKKRSAGVSVENCSIKFVDLDGKSKERKEMSIYQESCPQKSSIVFRNLLDGSNNHFVSSVVSIRSISEYSLISFECSVRFCSKNCSKTNFCRKSTISSTDRFVLLRQEFLLESQRSVRFLSSKLVKAENKTRTSLSSQENRIEFSLMIIVVALIFLMVISIGLFIVDRKFVVGKQIEGRSLIEMKRFHWSNEKKKSLYDVQHRQEQFFRLPSPVEFRADSKKIYFIG